MTSLRALVTVAWSTAVWIALWGDVSAGNVLGGVAVGLVAVWLVPLGRSGRPTGSAGIRPLRALHFLGYFVWALIRASAVVTWEIVTPRNRIFQGIIEVPLATRSLGVATVIANAISLTPGTLSIEIREDPLRVYVHVLHLRDIEAVRADLHRLERLAIAAFPTRVPDTEAAP